MAGPSLRVELRPEGLHVPSLDLFLDPIREVPRAFVSHAHGDHGAGWASGTVFGSRETLALLAARRGPLPGAHPLDWNDAIEMAVPGGVARVGIAPAGHVLGAAQLVIDHPKGRLVYTGDYRTGAGATHATGAPIACDTLVIESTFGLPIFRWPDRARVLEEIVAWCRRVLESGDTPVLLAYALGKSQSLIHALQAADVPVVAHGAVHRICEAYEALGVSMGVADGRLRPYAEEKKLGRLEGVLVSPPGTEAQPMIKKRTKKCVAYVSGWARIDAAIERRRADQGFVLSDHADFDDLVATVEASGARYVYVTHGEALPFATILRERGVESEALAARSIDEAEEAR